MQDLIRFYDIAMRLKRTKRAGWLRAGVPTAACESVADHVFGVALLAMQLRAPADEKLDRDRCLRLALVHDLAESIVGDITPHDPISREEKHRLERAAMVRLAAELGGAGGAELVELWEEFEAGTTPEAKRVRELDVVEMAWQARAYERDAVLGHEQAQPFIASAATRIDSDAGRALLAAAADESGASSGKP